MHEEMGKTEKQYKKITDIIKFLESTEVNDLCLKPKYVSNPNHLSWIDEFNLDEIETQSLIDRVKLMTITHLKLEKQKLKKSYLKSFTNKLFMRAKVFVEG